MLKPSNEQLKKSVIQDGLIKEKEFDKILKEARRNNQSIADILISKGIISLDYYMQLLSNIFETPLANLKSKKIETRVLNLIPENIARLKHLIAFDEKNNKISLAMADPTDLESIEYIEKLTQKKVKPFLASDHEIEAAFSYYGKELAKNYEKTIKENVEKSLQLKGDHLENIAKEIPIVNLFDAIISYAISLNASDIHIESLHNNIIIRFRIDGILREIFRFPKEVLNPLIARIKLLANLKIDEHMKPQDGRFRFKTLSNVLVDLRISIMPTYNGEKAVMRLLPASTHPLSLKELGMTEDQEKQTLEMISKPFGIILVCGPTGSGKTTTIYSMLNILNKPEVNIVTIEDPIEYEIPYINQTQVNPRAGLTFANALRSFLRQDPDIMFVGEIRDKETAEMAVQAALTGHLVISSLHTNDAAGAIPRLIDLGIPPFLVAASLNAIISQRLVRKICISCIESHSVTKQELQTIKEQFLLEGFRQENINKKAPSLLFQGKGCSVCNFTGYKGRTAIFEMMNVDEELRSLIAAGKATIDKIKEFNKNRGMTTMFEDGLKKASLGTTTLSEIIRVIKQ